MCHNQDRACQQRGENKKWNEFLPTHVCTGHGVGIELRTVCPGNKACGCDGDANQTVELVLKLDAEGLRKRYFAAPSRSSVNTIERSRLCHTRILIGAYIGDRLVGIIYIIKGEPADVAFATDPDFEDIGIASALLCIAIQILKQVDGRVNVQTCTLTENLPMRKVFERQPGMRYVPQSFRDDDYDPSVSKFAYNNS